MSASIPLPMASSPSSQSSSSFPLLMQTRRCECKRIEEEEHPEEEVSYLQVSVARAHFLHAILHDTRCRETSSSSSEVRSTGGGAGESGDESDSVR